MIIMKTREEIIFGMCMTYRHDYGLTKDDNQIISCGVTLDEREYIWNTMSQIFDNCIEPYMIFKP